MAGATEGEHQGSYKILVVDDEPDLEPLILQRMRRNIRAGRLQRLFSYEFLPNRSYFAHQLPLCSFRVPVSYIPLSGYCCLASYSLYSR